VFKSVCKGKAFFLKLQILHILFVETCARILLCRANRQARN